MHMDSEVEDFVDVTGDLLPADEHEDLAVNKAADVVLRKRPVASNQLVFVRYLALPFLFLTVGLLGGLRLSGIDSSFIFLKPPLLSLIFAAIMLVMFFRARLISLEGWFSETFSLLKNIAIR